LDNAIKMKIENEISRIDKNIEKHDYLFCLYESGKEPELRDVESGGTFMQSFYNGIENIVLMIFKEIGEDITNSGQWHTDLLNNAFESTEKRKAIFNNEYKDQLNDYKSFRHIFRHRYGYEIEWNDIKSLIGSVKELWTKIKNDINNFMNNKKYILMNSSLLVIRVFSPCNSVLNSSSFRIIA